jgi:putative polyhydroxyalkanoate system protein
MPGNWHHCAFAEPGRERDMADISIVHEHSLNPDMARAAAQKVADKVAAEYGMACRWEGEVLRFERSGVQGSLTLEARQAALRIELGFLMSAFAATIEAKVAESMRRVFGGRG